MDDLDRRIVKELQDNFPLEVNPYDVIAKNLGIDIDDLWQRVANLLDSGMIRRIGFSIDSRKMGYCSTLASISVPKERVDEASALLSSYPQVTHNYLRGGKFNVWFTIITENTQSISSILKEIQVKLGLSDDSVMDLPVKRLFKLDARFK